MDEMKTFLAVLRGRSLEAAAEILEVNHSTVYRRLQKLEERSGGKLFDRRGSTYTPTPRAQGILPVALRLERERAAFDRVLLGRAEHLVGRVRVTMPPGVVPLVRSALVEFHLRHPNVTLILNADQSVVDLLRGDADLAIRTTHAPDPELVGRRMAPVCWAAYSRVVGDPSEMRWAVYVESLRRVGGVHHRRRKWPDVLEAYQVDSALSMVQILSADDVVGYLPCYIADTEPALRRLTPPEPHGYCWVLYAPELRKSPHMHELAEHLMSVLTRRRGLFEGTRPAPW